MTETCGNCRYFTPQPRAAYGDCRAHPVYIVRAPGDWCGEWTREWQLVPRPDDPSKQVPEHVADEIAAEMGMEWTPNRVSKPLSTDGLVLKPGKIERLGADKMRVSPARETGDTREDTSNPLGDTLEDQPITPQGARDALAAMGVKYESAEIYQAVRDVTTGDVELVRMADTIPDSDLDPVSGPAVEGSDKPR